MLFSAAFSAKTYPTHTQQKKRLTRSQSFVETGFFRGLKRIRSERHSPRTRGDCQTHRNIRVIDTSYPRNRAQKVSNALLQSEVSTENLWFKVLLKGVRGLAHKTPYNKTND